MIPCALRVSTEIASKNPELLSALRRSHLDRASIARRPRNVFSYPFPSSIVAALSRALRRRNG
jgi:hypothetical protein